ncbi:putative transcription factor B3-Domain family [Helianthus annuus]|nr:putative transcription factor B3-Domain family [Helianthus annuus]
MRSWVLRYKRVNEDITITDGWKTILDDLGVKHGFLLDFTPFESYAEFMLTAFNVDFVIVFKSRKRHLTSQLLLFKFKVGFLR